jgi:hypothetical protein
MVMKTETSTNPVYFKDSSFVRELFNRLELVDELGRENSFFKTSFFQREFVANVDYGNVDSSADLTERNFVQDMRVVNHTKLCIFLCNYKFITTAWKDTPRDYFQSHLDFMTDYVWFWGDRFYQYVMTRLSGSINKSSDNMKEYLKISQWFGKNMSHKTYFNMIKQYCKKENVYGRRKIYNDDISTILCGIYQKNEIPRIPSRWTMTEFHDIISDQQTLLSVERENYDDVVLSESVVVDNYNIFEIKDTISLYRWARVVRNCVASYSDKIKEKKSRIICIEKDGSPKYTVEVEHRAFKNGRVVIKQSQEVYCSSGTTKELNKKALESLIKKSLA